MPTYRKLPVEIEAFQMTKERRWDNSEWPEWLNKAWNTEGVGSLYCIDGVEELYIRTLEGVMCIDWDDFIIQGVKGELYPCKPNIFWATYENVEQVPSHIDPRPKD